MSGHQYKKKANLFGKGFLKITFACVALCVVAYGRGEENDNNSGRGSHWRSLWQEAESRQETLAKDSQKAEIFHRFVSSFSQAATLREKEYNVNGIVNKITAEIFHRFALSFSQAATLREKAYNVNGIVNQIIEYTPDLVNYELIEYWACPIEVLERKRGDCEDYAILKYYTLRALGVPADRLYMTVVNNKGEDGGANHAVLLMNVAEQGSPCVVILENESALAELSERSAYIFYESMNETVCGLPNQIPTLSKLFYPVRN